MLWARRWRRASPSQAFIDLLAPNHTRVLVPEARAFLGIHQNRGESRDVSERPYLGWDSVEVLSQHSPHVLASVRRHLVLEQEGEVAALADAVEVAVDLVVLTPWEERRAVNDPTDDSFISGRSQHEVVAGTRQNYERQSGFVFGFF